jgi:hypothetical protein
MRGHGDQRSGFLLAQLNHHSAIALVDLPFRHREHVREALCRIEQQHEGQVQP